METTDIEEKINELEKENERLETMNQKLIEQMLEYQMDWHEKYTALKKKYNSCTKELDQLKTNNQIQLAENAKLKRLLTDRDNEILRLTEQLENLSKTLEQRTSKLKADFRIMFEKQSTFFLQKLDLLREEQTRYISKLLPLRMSD